MLGHALVQRLFGFPNALVCTIFTTLDRLEYMVQFVPVCFVLDMDKLLSQQVAGLSFSETLAM